MHLAVDDLLCHACTGYVHPFLDRCPACGAARSSRYGEAGTGGSIGAAGLVTDDLTRRAAHSVALRYTLRSSPGAAMVELPAAFGVVAGALPYRATVAAEGPTPDLPAGAATADAVDLLLGDGTLDVRARPAGRMIAAVPLAGILAATPIVRDAPGPAAWAGAILGRRCVLERRLVADAALLVTFSGPAGAAQVGLANRRGILAPRARADHYVTLARWIGILGAAAAEARWLAVGPADYVAQLGLGDRPGSTAALGDAGAPGAPGWPGASGASVEPQRPGSPAQGGEAAGVRSALEALEQLRAARLVSDEEYAAKRREILARL